MNPDVIALDEEITELSFLLSREQALSLIDVAQQEGMSAAQFVRQLVRQALAAQQAAPRFSLN